MSPFLMNTYHFQIDNAHFMQQTPTPVCNIVSLILKKFTVFHWQRRFIIVSTTAPPGIQSQWDESVHGYLRTFHFNIILPSMRTSSKILQLKLRTVGTGGRDIIGTPSKFSQHYFAINKCFLLTDYALKITHLVLVCVCVYVCWLIIVFSVRLLTLC